MDMNMSTVTYIFGIVAAVLALIAIIELMRRGTLRERHAGWWFVGGVMSLVIAVFPQTLGWAASAVGIVVPVARRSEVNAWLASWPELAADAPGARAAIDSSASPSGTDRVVVLTGLDTKGLEFDGIVVVAPQEIEDESATGRATLYVVLTRATQLLTTVS